MYPSHTISIMDLFNNHIGSRTNLAFFRARAFAHPAKMRFHSKQGKVMKKINVCLFTVLFATALLLSCSEKENSQDTTVPPQSTEAIVSESVQEADLQGEGLQGTNAEAQATDVLEATHTAIAENETDIGMTLIPSVEPEMLRNVMPNS